ncbi:SDCB1-like protein, partial [Mya arenaria]
MTLTSLCGAFVYDKSTVLADNIRISKYILYRKVARFNIHSYLFLFKQKRISFTYCTIKYYSAKQQKMSLYPSLEDMKVDQMAQAQRSYEQPQVTYPAQGGAQPGYPPAPQQAPRGSSPSLYPTLDEYMGLQLTPQFVQQNLPEYNQVAIPQNQPSNMMVAPVSGNDVGIRRAEIKQGLREVVACKDADGKIGLRIRHVNNGLFVALVQKDSPAALAGLRFGDQILQINGQSVAGWDTDKAHKVLKAASGDRISFAVRDRPHRNDRLQASVPAGASSCQSPTRPECPDSNRPSPGQLENTVLPMTDIYNPLA